MEYNRTDYSNYEQRGGMSMANFQLVKKDIEKDIVQDLYSPKGAMESMVYKSGKVVLILYVSSIMLTTPTSPTDIKDFKIYTKEAVQTEYTVPTVWEKRLSSIVKNKDILATIINDLPASIEWNKYDMQKPSETIIQNALNFIDICPDDNLLESVHVFSRVNGTILLKWNDSSRLATVNIGTKEFSYAILPKNGKEMINNDFNLDNADAVKGFYNKL